MLRFFNITLRLQEWKLFQITIGFLSKDFRLFNFLSLSVLFFRIYSVLMFQIYWFVWLTEFNQTLNVIFYCCFSFLSQSGLIDFVTKMLHLTYLFSSLFFHTHYGIYFTRLQRYSLLKWWIAVCFSCIFTQVIIFRLQTKSIIYTVCFI